MTNDGIDGHSAVLTGQSAVADRTQFTIDSIDGSIALMVK
jgi:hypothetical protein